MCPGKPKNVGLFQKFYSRYTFVCHGLKFFFGWSAISIKKKFFLESLSSQLKSDRTIMDIGQKVWELCTYKFKLSWDRGDFGQGRSLVNGLDRHHRLRETGGIFRLAASRLWVACMPSLDKPFLLHPQSQ